MQPNIWGKYIWISLHFIAIGFPTNPTEKEKTQYYSFFTNLHHVLPCETCAAHYKQLLDQIPLDSLALSSRENLFKWTFDIHNAVNKDIQKNELKYENAKMFYTSTLVKHNEKIQNMFNEFMNIKSKDESSSLLAQITITQFIVALGMLLCIIVLVLTFSHSK